MKLKTELDQARKESTDNTASSASNPSIAKTLQKIMTDLALINKELENTNKLQNIVRPNPAVAAVSSSANQTGRRSFGSATPSNPAVSSIASSTVPRRGSLPTSTSSESVSDPTKVGLFITNFLLIDSSNKLRRPEIGLNRKLENTWHLMIY